MVRGKDNVSPITYWMSQKSQVRHMLGQGGMGESTGNNMWQAYLKSLKKLVNVHTYGLRNC